jgi:hypothetical protein
MRSYLLVVSQDRTSAHTVTVYDLRNKLIAFAGNVGSVKMAVVEWGSIVLIGHDGRLHRLTEKDTLQKLDLLYKRNLYPMARKSVKRDLLVSNETYYMCSISGISTPWHENVSKET